MTPESLPPSSDSGVLARLRRAFRGALVWYGFVLPPLFLILVFIGYPTAIAFQQSVFTDVPGGGQKFAGTWHFERLLTDSVFWGALANSFLLGVAFLVIILPLATIFASMLKRVRRGST